MLFRKLPHKVTRYSILFLSCLMYLLAIRPVSDRLLSPLEESFPLPGQKFFNADYIVVLGGGSVLRKNNKTLGADATKRLLEGYLLQKKTGLPLIVSGGSPLYKDSPPESMIASELLTELGMDSRLIHLEDKSRNTFENAENIKTTYNPDTVILVTSAYHMKRSLIAFRELDFQVIPYPVDYKVEELPYIALDFFPSIQSLYKSYHALHEYIGMIYYSLRY